MSSRAEQCPKCKKDAAHRSKARWFGERWRKATTARRLYRCDNCNWRGWIHPMSHVGGAAIDVPPGPDLADLDSQVSPKDLP